jgi:Ser/Thr protein kinase RdoA (MazF antagonist)
VLINSQQGEKNYSSKMNTFAAMQSFPVEYSSLSAASLLQFIASSYNLEPSATIVFLKRGFNDTYLVTSGDQKFILRIYKYRWRTLADIHTELELLLYLNEKGTAVSIPLPDTEKEFIQAIQAPEGTRYAVLFSYAEGVQIKKITIEQAYLLGAETGKLHRLTKDKQMGATAQDYAIQKQFQHTVQVLQPVLIDHPAQYLYLLQLEKLFLATFENIKEEDLATGICHGDLQSENFHVTGGNKFTFFDFDFFGTGYLIYDIGVFMWYDHKNKPPEIMRSFLKGYESQRPLTTREHQLIPWFSTLRAIFQMTLYCTISDGKQLPLWPAQQVAAFINKVEKWHATHAGLLPQ